MRRAFPGQAAWRVRLVAHDEALRRDQDEAIGREGRRDFPHRVNVQLVLGPGISAADIAMAEKLCA